MEGYGRETLGSILRDRRTERGVSLKEMSEQTRIRRHHLEALEENRFADLPGRAYIRGFLKLYSEALGLNVDRLLSIFEEQTAPAILEIVPAGTRQSRKDRPMVLGVSLVLGILAVGGAALLLLGGGQKTESYDSISAQSSTPSAQEPESGESFVQGPPPMEEAPAPASAAVPVQETAFVPPSSPPSSTSPTSLNEEKPALSSVPHLPPAGGAIRLESLGQLRLELSLDGRPSMVYDLSPGAVLGWKAEKSARLRVDNPSGVRVWVEGQLAEFSENGELFLQGH